MSNKTRPARPLPKPMKASRARFILLFAVCLAMLGGCATLHQGPALEELELLGDISHGVYRASGGVFSVAVPHAADSREQRSLSVHDDVTETETESLTSVAFGPGATDPAIYRVVLSTLLDGAAEQQPLGDRADLIMSSFMVLYDDEFGGMGEQMLRKQLTIDGREAVYAVYRYAPAQEGMRVFYTVFCFSEVSERQLVNVMASRWTSESPWHPGVDKLLARKWRQFNDFVASLEVPAASQQ